MNRVEFGKDGCEVTAMAGVDDYARGDFADFDIEDE